MLSLWPPKHVSRVRFEVEVEIAYSLVGTVAESSFYSHYNIIEHVMDHNPPLS